MKAKAEIGVKISPSINSREAVPEAPANTAIVLTTASLAVKPVIRAVAARQSPKPKGAKRGAAALPIRASMLSSLLETMLKPKSLPLK